MATLHNESKNLRLVLQLVDREVSAPFPGLPAPRADKARVIGTASVEFFDRRDGAFWPFLRLPVLYLSGSDVPDLVESLRALCAERQPGIAFRTGLDEEVQLQIGRVESGFLVEVGLDLARYLVETSGLQGVPGRELALFRFTAQTAELVRFADQLTGELSALRPPRA